MRVTLWGTRGSLASPGPETVQYGGNTSCVEVRGANGSVIILDAGTGIRRLGATLAGTGRIDILLSHLHTDHIQGLGFFAPLFQQGRPVHIWGPPSGSMDLRARLTRYLSAPLFPVHLRELPSELVLHDATPGQFEIDGTRVSADYVVHPGLTLGYRLSEPGATLAYLSDHEPALGRNGLPEDTAWTSGYALAKGTDLLIHDSQYTDAEYPSHTGWGHSTIGHAVALAENAGARCLVTFHHDPDHADADLDAMHEEVQRRLDSRLTLIPGTEGLTLNIGS